MSSLHTAPPVRYPVQRSLWLARALVCGAILGFFVLLAWAAQGARTPQHGLQLAAGAALWCVACVLSCRFWMSSVCGVLVWDGQAWFLEMPQHRLVTTGLVAVHLDLQAHLWLRWQSGQGQIHWLWLEQYSDRQRWSDLRRAVYSRAVVTAAESLQPVAPRDPSA